MPPNCLSREFTGAIKKFSVVAPTPLHEYQLASMFRFANSDRDYFLDLANRTRQLCGSSLSCLALGRGRLPDGSLCCPPILNRILDALEFQGDYRDLRIRALGDPSLAWILVSPVTPSGYESRTSESAPRGPGLLGSVLRRQL